MSWIMFLFVLGIGGIVWFFAIVTADESQIPSLDSHFKSAGDFPAIIAAIVCVFSAIFLLVGTVAGIGSAYETINQMVGG